MANERAMFLLITRRLYPGPHPTSFADHLAYSQCQIRKGRGTSHIQPRRSRRLESRLAGYSYLFMLVALSVALIGATVLVVQANLEEPLEIDRAAQPPLPSPATPETVTAELASLQKFIEQARGLQFKSPVHPVVMPDQQFRDKLLQGVDADYDAESTVEAQKIFRALKLIPPDFDLGASVRDLLGVGVVGYYDSRTKELVVRGTELSPYVRSTLVHELTHALQDQHFGLNRPELDERNDEVSLGFQAITEGDAERIQSKFIDRLPRDEREAARRAAISGPVPTNIPEVLIGQIVLPYQLGPPLVEALVKHGGQARLDAAFASPPSTSEQILHPERFIAGEEALRVAKPPAEGRVFDEGVFGEVMLVLMLSETIPLAQSLTAADGWGGDYYVAWDQGGRACLRLDTLGDEPSDQAELVDALTDWARAHRGARVERLGPRTRLTACA